VTKKEKQNNNPFDNRDLHDEDDKVLATLIATLQKRADKHSRIATFYIVLISIIVVGGLLVFIYAYQFSNSALVPNRIDAISKSLNYQNEIPDNLFLINRPEDTVLMNRNLILTTKKSGMSYYDSIQYYKYYKNLSPYLKYEDSIFHVFRMDMTIYLKELRRLYYELQQLPRNPNLISYDTLRFFRRKIDSILFISNDIDYSVDYVGAGFDVVHENFLADNDSIKQMLATIKSKVMTNTNYDFFETLSTRIGSVVLVLFLVQVLLRIFRYNTRLASYYQGRVDALEVYSMGEELKLDVLIPIFSPDSIDMGVSKTPIEQVLDIMKQAPKSGKAEGN
jgi:hypothetical protein